MSTITRSSPPAGENHPWGPSARKPRPRGRVLWVTRLLFLLLGPGGIVPSARAEMAGSAVQSSTPVLKAAANSTPNVPAVLRVSRDADQQKQEAGSGAPGTMVYNPSNVYAQRDDDLFVHVQNLEAWMKGEETAGRMAAGAASIRNLVLYLNAIPLRGVHPNHYFIWPEFNRDLNDPTAGTPSRDIHYLRFTLARTEDCKSAWSRLLREPDFHPRPMEVSVGFEGGEPMPTFITASGLRHFYFVPISMVRFVSGAVILCGSLWFFLWLAGHTDIIRDTDAPLRPDGRRPYSLSRAQMAFWFFLTVSAFFVLWVLTGAMDTLNSSVLGLIGISAATALGAALVDAASPATEPAATVARTGRNLPAVDLSQPRRKILEQLRGQVAEAEADLASLEKQRLGVTDDDPAAREASAMAIAEARGNLELLRKQRRYFQWPAWRGVIYDLLAEREHVSFHRFQILVWSLVLGGVFVAKVYSELAMPEFNATLLGLLGISGGTYVGFKLPAAQQG